MGKLILAVVIGLVGAAIVHIVVIFAIPLLAGNNAWGRLGRIAGMETVVRIDSQRQAGSGSGLRDDGPGAHDFAFIDPAFVTAACRFSLEDGPVRVTAPAATEFWSASIYSRQGDNLYSINDRSAVKGRFDLLLGTPEQLVDAEANSVSQDETAIPVGLDLAEGYLTLRVLVGDETQRPGVDAFVRSLRCQKLEPAGLAVIPEATGTP
ncbi:DUF1254 domain-containing protein [Aureimonas sp. SA4125]|uniref:DUF1254 domain-containing protein n=1 Tax=Aureimonas sp. SA4125 TaxID=2826993 RepID=UPI001CC3D913|nr:DUF1254 domain-containing protein [Aureimonas sp. SA4125]BDA83677.1 DUF1254 domain-containing protein [Aureimonas sp. SA4125]